MRANMFSGKRHSGRRLWKTPVTPTTPATMVEPSHVDDSTRQQPPSKLKRMSDATVRHLARPLSMISRRSSTSSRQPTPNKLQKPASRNSAASRPSRAERPESSRRSSLLSNGASSVAHDEDESLGELPVFGISQRAYLASLMSLFTNGNDTPQSANTPITEPDSNAPSLGPYEYDIHSAAIYKYSKSRRLYVGWPELVHPPPEALLEFEMETLPLLERDLQGVSGHLGQQGIRLTYELRMSGYARAAAETVSLSPTVWILYRAGSYVGAQISVAELHQAVAGIFYLQNGLEIQEGGGRIELTSDRGLINVRIEEKESIKMSDGGKLSVHMEDCHDKYSVCGALCCVTTEEGSRRVQSLCRIGGLLKINGKYILGVSTAHGMLDGSDIFKDSFDDTAPTHVPAGQAVDRDIILTESKRVAKWHNATRDAAVDFLGISMNSRGEMAINRSKPENATDFALLRLRKIPTYVRNKYMPPGAEEAVSITSTASASAAAMDEGSVHMLCGGGDVVQGQLVWGSACFIVRGRNFRVRRIQISRPLSASTTGSWVVRGEVLYGCIIAVYENEPFALMMTVERLFASILGSAFSIRTVELWDGEVPEALKTYASAELTKTTNNTAPRSTRRRAQTDTRVNPNGEGPSTNRAQTLTHEDRTGEGSSRNPSKIHEVNGNGTNSTSSEGTQPLSPRPQVVHDNTSSEEPNPPREGSAVSKSPHNNDEGVAPTRRTRAKPAHRGRTGSYTSDMSMSGAMQDHLPESKGKQRCHTGDSEMSTGAQTTYTTASETLERQDSGFDSETAPTQTDETMYEKDFRESHDFTDQLAREALDLNLRGGASRSGDSTMRSEGDSREIPGAHSTGTAPKSRKGSLQTVLGKTFRRSSSDSGNQGRSQDDRHGNGIPPTGLSTRRALFARRRSSSKDPESVSTDNNFGIPPTGLNGRPLSFFRRSTGKSSEVEQPKNDTGGGSNSSGDRARPSSFTRQPAGKSRQSEQANKDNNFGIPHQGL